MDDLTPAQIQLLRKLALSRRGNDLGATELYGLLSSIPAYQGGGLKAQPMQWMPSNEAELGRIEPQTTGRSVMGFYRSGQRPFTAYNPSFREDVGPTGGHELEHSALYKRGIPSTSQHAMIRARQLQGYLPRRSDIRGYREDVTYAKNDPARMRPSGGQPFVGEYQQALRASQRPGAKNLGTAADPLLTKGQGRPPTWAARRARTLEKELADSPEGRARMAWWLKNKRDILRYGVPHA